MMALIGDAIDTFVGLEENFLNGKYHFKPRMLVEVPTHSSALDDLEMIYTNGKWIQRVEIDKFRDGGKCISPKRLMPSNSNGLLS